MTLVYSHCLDFIALLPHQFPLIFLSIRYLKADLRYQLIASWYASELASEMAASLGNHTLLAYLTKRANSSAASNAWFVITSPHLF